MNLVRIYTIYQGANVQWTSIDPSSVESINPAQVQCEGVWRPGTEITMKSGAVFRSPASSSEVESALRQGVDLRAPGAPVVATIPTPGAPVAALPPGMMAPAPAPAPAPYVPNAGAGFAPPVVAAVVGADAPFVVPPLPGA